MHITLIGMSNIGKSYWSKKLAARNGFERIACDERIEQKLEPELTALGYAGIRDVARWMGQPFDAQYAATSEKYLRHEHQVMHEAIEHLKTAAQAVVIDTTGSVVYAGSDIAKQLHDLTRVVYFEASPDHIARLYEKYIASPKPVIWGDAYAPQAGESPEATLKRCYPALLAGRALRYRDMAHVTIPYTQHRASYTDIISMIGFT